MSNFMLKMLAGSSAGAGLPTLGSLSQWIQTEGGNALTIILVCFCVWYAFKQSWGKLIGFLILAGIVFFTIGNPSRVLDTFSGLGTKLMGG